MKRNVSVVRLIFATRNNGPPASQPVSCLTRLSADLSVIWLSIGYFQQDGATSHTSHASMTEIQSFFGDRLISKGLWPHRSLDLTPPDYFLWGYLKGRVYQTNHEP